MEIFENMRIEIILSVFLSCVPGYSVGAIQYGSNAVWSDEDLAQESRQVEMWEANLRKAEAMPSAEKLDFLKLGLKTMGSRLTKYRHPENVARIYKALQEEFISIPGHAKYFADQIREAKATKSYKYDQLRNDILRLYFPNIPSPESVAELGSFINDESDISYPRPFTVLCNCDHAMFALKQIGLRKSPNTRITYLGPTDESDDLNNWRLWWKKVKAGQLAFSFEGKNVEYRFKPDGTWIEGPLGTTKPGDTATNSTGGPLRATKRNAESPQGDATPAWAEKASKGSLPYMFGGLILLSGIVIYLRGRKRKT